jgi:hypothetical protein
MMTDGLEIGGPDEFPVVPAAILSNEVQQSATKRQ